MAQYARETVYVLDVREHDSTWLQAYAYAEAADQGGEAVETGTVTPMDTRVAMKMLHDMVANGVMPPCMVLQWRETGNHFQALTYDEEKYKTYADNLPAMVSTRNSIRVQHGEQALDAVPYDELKNARAAAQTLKVIRKKSKVTMKLEQAGTRLGTDSRSDGGNEVDREVDRFGGSRKADIGASELARLVDREGLIDTGYYNKPGLWDHKTAAAYAMNHHTHRHKAASGAIGTSRLDRFYIRASARRLVRGVVTEESPCQADHRAVLLELHSPLGAIRIKKRGKLYPPPAYVSTAMSNMIKSELQDLDRTIRDADPGRTAVVWQDFKTEHVRHISSLKKQARERMTNGYRLRIKRLKQKLRKLEGEETGVHSERRAVLDAIARLQTARRASRKRVLVARSAWSSKQSTKHFFRRICTKFGDNTIPTLRQITAGKTRNRRSDHDKSNIMADSWFEIFNGQADEKDDIASYIAQYQDQWKRIDLTEIDADIMEDEVAEAIRRCKPGKAVGPDQLGNEWYRDHAEELVPILTKLFNDCMAEGCTVRAEIIAAPENSFSSAATCAFTTK
ncbi:hypothetical protein PR003_g29596 [Phytophthora rubi]|uniref:Endonuclease/exonuclease/phosphatase domain-containing protein n=1 Tax=Phytophthora rubi TaxID=129364 RepID=A0A6A4BGA6_9STRA|nr:hypothetical protein PR003_g29596 [Phytophthora rubi]